LNARTASYLRT
jgi:hypothetical protein